MVYIKKEIVWYINKKKLYDMYVVWNCPFLCGTLSTLRIHLLNDSNVLLSSVQFSPLICVQYFATPWTAARQASLSITNSQSLLKLMSIETVMPSNHLILCHPLLLLPSIFLSTRVFSNESVLCIRWPKYEFQLQHQSFQ